MRVSLIFDNMGIDTNGLSKRIQNGTKIKAGTGWRHCIGVDPYYLTFKSEAWLYSKFNFSCEENK